MPETKPPKLWTCPCCFFSFNKTKPAEYETHLRTSMGLIEKALAELKPLRPLPEPSRGVVR